MHKTNSNKHKEEIDNNTIVGGNLKLSLTSMDTPSTQVINKE